MDRLSQLRSAVIRARQAYYLHMPIMGDDAYDALEEELKRFSPLGENDPVLQMVGCPIPPDNVLEKAEHRIHMGSQDKVNSEAEFREWYNKRASGGQVLVSLKGDGGSAAAYYEDGYLKQGISRGDGIVGQDISATMVRFKGLPAFICEAAHGFSGSVRFEGILTKEDWGIVGGKNPRNQGNGIMNRSDGVEAEYITAFAFDISNEIEFRTEADKFRYLEGLGVNVMPWKLCADADEVIEYYTETMDARGTGNGGTLPFWIDGIVVKINDLAVQDAVGYAPSGKYHKGQIAWKPESEGAVTILRSYEITGGHTGALVPNARFDPVEVGGTTISNALMNNWEEIARLGIAVGDTIYVTKRNDIIPKIEEVVAEGDGRTLIPEPTRCPFCGGKVGRNQKVGGADGAITMCLNPSCYVKHDGRLKSWFKKTKILGVGDSVREALHDQLNVHTADDIYLLGTEIITIEAMREVIVSGKSRLGGGADNLVEEINKKRVLPLHIFLGSLGIEDLGRREVEIACQKAEKLKDSCPLKWAESMTLRTLDDWRGDKLADSDLQVAINAPNKAPKWVTGINEMSGVIDGLLSNGVTVLDFEPSDTPPVAAGTTVCITGTLPSGKKKAEYRESLEAIGLALVDKVSKDLGYLVTANPQNNTGKTKKANGYNEKGANIQIITEDDLITMTG